MILVDDRITKKKQEKKKADISSKEYLLILRLLAKNNSKEYILFLKRNGIFLPEKVTYGKLVQLTIYGLHTKGVKFAKELEIFIGKYYESDFSNLVFNLDVIRAGLELAGKVLGEGAGKPGATDAELLRLEQQRLAREAEEAKKRKRTTTIVIVIAAVAAIGLTVYLTQKK